MILLVVLCVFSNVFVLALELCFVSLDGLFGQLISSLQDQNPFVRLLKLRTERLRTLRNPSPAPVLRQRKKLKSKSALGATRRRERSLVKVRLLRFQKTTTKLKFNTFCYFFE